MTDQAKKYLSDILLALELIEQFTAGIKDFPNSSLKHVKNIVGLRNRLIHAYDAIDASIIWAIINRHLAPLRSEIEDKLD